MPSVAEVQGEAVGRRRACAAGARAAQDRPRRATRRRRAARLREVPDGRPVTTHEAAAAVPASRLVLKEELDIPGAPCVAPDESSPLPTLGCDAPSPPPVTGWGLSFAGGGDSLGVVTAGSLLMPSGVAAGPSANGRLLPEQAARQMRKTVWPWIALMSLVMLVAGHFTSSARPLGSPHTRWGGGVEREMAIRPRSFGCPGARPWRAVLDGAEPPMGCAAWRTTRPLAASQSQPMGELLSTMSSIQTSVWMLLKDCQPRTTSRNLPAIQLPPRFPLFHWSGAVMEWTRVPST